MSEKKITRSNVTISRLENSPKTVISFYIYIFLLQSLPRPARLCRVTNYLQGTDKAPPHRLLAASSRRRDESLHGLRIKGGTSSRHFFLRARATPRLLSPLPPLPSIQSTLSYTLYNKSQRKEQRPNNYLFSIMSQLKAGTPPISARESRGKITHRRMRVRSRPELFFLDCARDHKCLSACSVPPARFTRASSTSPRSTP